MAASGQKAHQQPTATYPETTGLANVKAEREYEPMFASQLSFPDAHGTTGWALVQITSHGNMTQHELSPGVEPFCKDPAGVTSHFRAVKHRLVDDGISKAWHTWHTLMLNSKL